MTQTPTRNKMNDEDRSVQDLHPETERSLVRVPNEIQTKRRGWWGWLQRRGQRPNGAVHVENSSEPSVSSLRVPFGTGMPRRWSDWPGNLGRIGSDLIFGILLTLCGLIATAISTALNLHVQALLIFLIPVSYALYNSFPKKYRAPHFSVGNTFTLDQLANFPPNLPRLGFVGLPGVGKTRWREALLPGQKPSGKTDELKFQILNLPTPNQQQQSTPFAVLDGDGGKYNHLGQIIASVQLLVVMLDHNEGNDPSIDWENRLPDHVRFLRAVEVGIRDADTRGHKVKHVFLMINKKDLWEKETDVRDFRNWFSGNAQFDGLENTSNFSEALKKLNIESTSLELSSIRSEDVSDFVQTVMRAWANSLATGGS